MMAAIPLRVLILEDRPADAELMVVELRRSELAPDWVRVDSESDFLAHLDPALDVILADYRLPQFDALQALYLLQQRGLDIPFIIVTGSLGDELAAECVKRGASDYVLKDRMSRLGLAVQSAIEQKRLREARAEAERRVQESEELYRAVVENANDAIVINVGTERQFVNRGFLALHGLKDRDEVVGLPLDQFIVAEDKDLVNRNTLARQRGESVEGIYEYRIRRTDGEERTVQTSAVPITYRGQPASLAILRDVTERKRAEEELREYSQTLEKTVEELRTTTVSRDELAKEVTQRKQAEQSLQAANIALTSSNAELEAFSYSVAHDLRSPLRAIDGFSQALSEKYLDRLDERGTDYLQRVRSAAQRMGELIDDLLGLSRVARSDMHRELVNLSALVQSVAAEQRRREPNRQVELEVQENVTVNCDLNLLKIALENLLGNAWKYTRKHPHAKVEFGVTEHEGTSAYFVRDDGAGFDMEYSENLFGTFKRLHTEAEFEGTGIGLATVKRIIQRHGGRVWAEGAVEQGATFFFTLEESSPSE